MYLEPMSNEPIAASESAEQSSGARGGSAGSRSRRFEKREAGAGRGRFPKVDDILDRLNRRTLVGDR